MPTTIVKNILGLNCFQFVASRIAKRSENCSRTCARDIFRNSSEGRGNTSRDETGDLISFGYAEALVALNRLFERGSAGVPLRRIELFFGLFESVVGPANILLLSADDVSALQRWLSMADDQDEWRGVLVPTKLSFLSAAECVTLKTELQSAVYPYYCTCNTMLGQTNREQELIACEATGGCKGKRWFHRECGHEPDEDGNFVCTECRENE